MKARKLIERLNNMNESDYTTYTSKRKDRDGNPFVMRSYKNREWAKKNAFDIPSVSIFKQGDVYAQLSVLPYSDADFTEIYFVSDKQGNEFGQYATKDGALKKAKEMAKLSLADRKQHDESKDADANIKASGAVSEDAKQISNTILQQLGGNKFIAMTGAKNMAYDKDGSLSFKVGRNPSGITHVKISLNGKDLYDMKFYKLRGTDLKVAGEHNDIYSDSLGDIFSRETGLAIRL